MAVSPGASGMQPRDPCRPWRGTLASGQNNQQVTEEIKREIKKFLETNDNENTTQNLWDAAKVVLREKYIAI